MQLLNDFHNPVGDGFWRIRWLLAQIVGASHDYKDIGLSTGKICPLNPKENIFCPVGGDAEVDALELMKIQFPNGSSCVQPEFSKRVSHETEFYFPFV